MTPHDEQVIDRLYERLNEGHERLREEFAARLPANDAGRSAQIAGASGSNRRSMWGWITVGGLSAAILIAGSLWLGILGRPEAAWAALQEAVARQKWMRIEFADGEEEWISLQDGATFRKGPGGQVSATSRGLRQQYVVAGEMSAFGVLTESRIVESRATPDQAAKIPEWKPASAWDLVVGHMERMEERAAESPYTFQKTSITENGRELWRFDIHRSERGVAESLFSQVWVDPDTRLPVRLSKAARSPQGTTDGTFIAGTFTFPESGPKDLYDLGVPRDTPIAKISWESEDATKYPTDVRSVIAEAQKAADRFPSRFRLLMWPAGDVPGFKSGPGAPGTYVLYWDGKPTLKRDGERTEMDFSKVRIRQSSYWIVKKAAPVDATGVVAQLANEKPSQIELFDGKRSYDYRPTERPPTLDVQSRFGMPPSPTIAQFRWPVTLFRMFLGDGRGMGGRGEIVATPPDEAPGTILLRYHWEGRSAFVHSDYYVDPAHDHLCLKVVHWQKRGDELEKVFEDRLEELRQLPGGAWYGTRYTMLAHSENGWGNVSHIDVAPLSDADFPADTFDGAKLVDQAKALGAAIRPR